jgi:hypothetical protein
MQLLAESCEFFARHTSRVMKPVKIMINRNFALDNAQILI